jgi:hypothetical protein
MLFTALILVSIDCEHDGLKKGVYLGHGDKAAEMGDMSRFGLKEEKKVAIFLCFLVVWKETFLQI